MRRGEERYVRLQERGLGLGGKEGKWKWEGGGWMDEDGRAGRDGRKRMLWQNTVPYLYSPYVPLSSIAIGLRVSGSSGLRTQDSGLRTQDSGLWTLDSGLRMAVGVGVGVSSVRSVAVEVLSQAVNHHSPITQPVSR